MQIFTRGATVTVSVIFRDAAGDPVTPGGATLVLSYRNRAGVKVESEVAMAEGDGDAWVADWDSEPARAGKVYCHVKTASPSPISADDFVFTLVANQANEAA
jgi:hypothetical protein